MLSRLRPAVLAVIVAAFAVAACSRPSAEDCEAALRNWFTLIYWDDAEKEIAAAPAAQREALRQTKLADKDKKLADGMELGVLQCRGSRDHDGVKCMKAATTATQARTCRAPKDK